MAKSKNLNTVVKFEMLDGEVGMTLQMFALYQLRATNKGAYDAYNQITTKGIKDGDLDLAQILYTAYLCACVNSGEDDRYGSYEEFLMSMPSDREAMQAAYKAMCAPKSLAFRDAFKRRARKGGSGLRVPDFELADVEDRYAYYVMILGIPEDLFWYADVAFVEAVAADKGAYDEWLSGEQRHAAEKAKARSRG